MLQTNAGSCNRMLLQRMLKAHQRLRLQLLALQTWKLNNGCDCCANECWKLINGCNCWMLQTNAESSTTAAIAGCCKRMLLQRMLKAHQRLQSLDSANECWSSTTAAIAGCCKRMLKAQPRLRKLQMSWTMQAASQRDSNHRISRCQTLFRALPRIWLMRPCTRGLSTALFGLDSLDLVYCDGVDRIVQTSRIHVFLVNPTSVYPSI
jgi:hypothetical protein